MSSDKLLKQQSIAELSSIDFQIDDLVSRVISAANDPIDIVKNKSVKIFFIAYFLDSSNNLFTSSKERQIKILPESAIE